MARLAEGFWLRIVGWSDPSQAYILHVRREEINTIVSHTAEVFCQHPRNSLNGEYYAGRYYTGDGVYVGSTEFKQIDPVKAYALRALWETET